MIESNFPLRFVLVGTTHPGNIGASARALKTMGCADWFLVNPCAFSAESGPAKAMAAGAEDWLQQARVVDSLEEALRDCVWVVGASVRIREVPWPMHSPREVGQRAMSLIQTQGPVAIVLGRERYGLLNEELALCQGQLMIPANPSYGSLNIASALQIIAYECRVAYLEQKPIPPAESTEPLASNEELERLFGHWDDVLTQIEFFNPHQKEGLMLRLRRLFQRMHLERREYNIIRGILTQVEKKCR